MKRTITMNLGGTIFLIEEDAYDMLSKYLSTIKGYFKNSESRDEIMSDIELRIAEMLQEKVNKIKQAIMMLDVENVIVVMGKPEDIAGESEKPESDSSSNFSQNESRTNDATTKKRRVFTCEYHCSRQVYFSKSSTCHIFLVTTDASPSKLFTIIEKMYSWFDFDF